MRGMAAPAGRWLGILALALSPLLIHLALVGWAEAAPPAPGASRIVTLGLVAASALPHALVNAALLALFGLTLLPGREPLITALARTLSGALSDEAVAYTRGVTWAWSLFFAAQLLVSPILFLAAPLPAWSFFVNVLNLPLVILMFAAEYAFRLRHLRDAPRHSLSDVMRMIGYIKERLSTVAGPG